MPSPIRILVVDDDATDRLHIDHLLARGSELFAVAGVGSLVEAEQQLKLNHFDLVLLDLMLGPTHGLCTLESFLSLREVVPVVVLSGVSGEELALQAVESGAQDYIAKDKLELELASRTIKHAIQSANLRAIHVYLDGILANLYCSVNPTSEACEAKQWRE